MPAPSEKDELVRQGVHRSSHGKSTPVARVRVRDSIRGTALGKERRKGVCAGSQNLSLVQVPLLFAASMAWLRQSILIPVRSRFLREERGRTERGEGDTMRKQHPPFCRAVSQDASLRPARNGLSDQKRLMRIFFLLFLSRSTKYDTNSCCDTFLIGKVCWA